MNPLDNLSLLRLLGAIPPALMFSTIVGATTVLLIWASLRYSAALADPLRRRMQAMRDSYLAPLAAPGGGWLSHVLRRPPAPQPVIIEEQPAHAGPRGGGPAPGSSGGLMLLRVGLMLGLGGAVLVAGADVPRLQASPGALWLFALIGSGFGWLAPRIVIERREEARKRRLMDGLPDALDLLVACTEAGLGLNAALERVAEQMPASHPELAKELGLVNAEVRAGIDRNAALRNLAERTGLEEIRGLVSLITHSMRLGTGIAGTLRIYADEFRDRRMQRAEEQAAMVGTKLIFPLVFCIFPAFFVVATGPAIVGVLRVLTGMGWKGF